MVGPPLLPRLPLAPPAGVGLWTGPPPPIVGVAVGVAVGVEPAAAHQPSETGVITEAVLPGAGVLATAGASSPGSSRRGDSPGGVGGGGSDSSRFAGAAEAAKDEGRLEVNDRDLLGPKAWNVLAGSGRMQNDAVHSTFASGDMLKLMLVPEDRLDGGEFSFP